MSPENLSDCGNLREELSSWQRRLRALRSLPAAGKLIWNASPRFVFYDLVLRAVIATIPIVAMWVGKLIIDRVAATANHPNPDLQTIWLLV